MRNVQLIYQDLTEIGDRIARYEKEQDVRKGRLQTLMENLKKEFGFSTIQEAVARLEEIAELLKQKQATLEERYKKLKQVYDF